MKYKIFKGLTAKADADEYVAHMDKLAPIPIPEAAKDLRVDPGCKVPLKDMLADHWCLPLKHPDKTEYAFPVGAEEEKHADHVDPTSAHKLDFKDAVDALPEDWTPSADVTEIG